METHGFVLAGGRGRRLAADRPKASVAVAGRTLLERACGTLASLAGRVVVIAPEDIDLPLDPAHTRVHDEGQGPLAALVLAGNLWPARRLVVLAADLPLVDRDLLAALDASREEAIAVAATAQGVIQPLALWLTLVGLHALQQSHEHGERSLSRALEAIGAKLVPSVGLPGGEEAFLDVDTPEDLARMERTLSERAR